MFSNQKIKIAYYSGRIARIITDSEVKFLRPKRVELYEKILKLEKEIHNFNENLFGKNEKYIEFFEQRIFSYRLVIPFKILNIVWRLVKKQYKRDLNFKQKYDDMIRDAGLTIISITG